MFPAPPGPEALAILRLVAVMASGLKSTPVSRSIPTSAANSASNHPCPHPKSMTERAPISRMSSAAARVRIPARDSGRGGRERDTVSANATCGMRIRLCAIPHRKAGFADSTRTTSTFPRNSREAWAMAPVRSDRPSTAKSKSLRRSAVLSPARDPNNQTAFAPAPYKIAAARRTSCAHGASPESSFTSLPTARRHRCLDAPVAWLKPSR